ncbi:sm-like protein LSM1B isoform X2 [Cucurbita pepo subsp. pepo]|uniref:sm-like protein LSM1B isoform X2 n=1 Tax=Cucurbita pepo subsp. pepo TaxID=3664 RepID=UPI000C9D3911|nr:sm-like protein LSM1B isoform X2 [Cucurbita pepo subsp. pepo]
MMVPSVPEYIFRTPCIGSYLDRKLLILLLDGRCIIGTMCTFDQHGNFVVESAFERIVAENQYCDKPMGLLVVRGDNAIFIGEMDLSFPELPPHITAVSLPQILIARKAELESSALKRTLKKWMEELLDGV